MPQPSDRCWSAPPRQGALPAACRALLTEPGSLTAAVRALSRHLQVLPLHQGWRRPDEDERHLLGLRRGATGWIREVVLHDAGVPLIFAHTVLAARDLSAWPWLRGLGCRPLGEVLFQHPRIERLPLRFACLPTRHPLHRGACRASGPTGQPLWARRSLFCLEHRPLLVTEVFLPAVWQRCQQPASGQP